MFLTLRMVMELAPSEEFKGGDFFAACVAGRSPSFARSRKAFDVLSLSLNKESTKENQPRRSLLELPWHCRSSKRTEEKNLRVYFASLAAQLPRAADMPEQEALRVS